MSLNRLRELNHADEASLQASLCTLDLSKLLGSLHVFIETAVRYLPDEELNIK